MSPPPRGTVAIAYALSATGILANSIILPVLPDIARDLEVSTGQIGLIVAAASFPGILAAPLIGVLADRFGRRPVVVPCLVIFGIGGLAAGLAPSFEVMLALRLVQGVGAAGLVNLAIVVLGDHFEGTMRARMIGRNALALTIGLSVFPTVGGFIGEHWGWRASFIPYGASVVMAVIAAAVLPSTRPSHAVSMSEQLRSARSSLRDPRVYAMAAAGFAVFILVFGVATTLPLHLDEEFAAGALTRGLLLALPAVGAGMISIGMGKLSERWGAWDMVPLGFALIAVAYAGVPIAPALALVTVPALAYGMGEAFTIVPLQDYAAQIATPEHRGVVIAVWVAAARAGQSVGPAVAGFTISTIGTGGTFVAGTAFAAVLTAVSLGTRPGLKARGLAPG
ncbi:MAG TPA: MFS transporter [Acidimicrobiia bacterium]|nr:MFS transporter [Acidimicrobiia bacterium]